MWNPFSLFKSSSQNLLSASDKQMLVQAIQAAEKTTSGEIRVFVESKIPKKQDALQRATEIFFKNNPILSFYLLRCFLFTKKHTKNNYYHH